MAEVERGGSREQSGSAHKHSRKLKKQVSMKERKVESTSSEEEEEQTEREGKEEEEEEQRTGAELITGRVIAEQEIGHFVDLGLGRGVDATKSSPWLSKSSFQVRKVTSKNIIGTEEGGLINNFEDIVESVQQLQTNMSASVPCSQQVSVGVDSELSRSYSKTKKSIGTKVLTRTISFKADFDDICVRRRKRRGGKQRHTAPQRSQTLPEGGEAKAKVEAALDRTPSSSGEEHEPTFEERLSNWILSHLKGGPLTALERLIDDKEIAEDANPIDKMNLLIDSGMMKRKDLRPLCHDFVTATSITHYVCAIELGASTYKTMSEDEVQTQLKTKGKVGVSSAADVSVSQQAKWYNRNKKKHETKIGAMDKDGKVERGTTGEAVVGVKFQPLSSVVVRCNMLKKALEVALQRYIDSQGIAKYGPFYISCNSEQLFLKEEDNKVIVTDDITDASHFFVVPCEEDGKRRHFSIFYNSKSKLNPPDTKPRYRVKPIARYLCAYVNFRGMCDNPLDLKLNAKESKSMLVLHDRRSKHFQPVELTDWINGKEIYFINCKHRAFKKDSYICVTGRPSTEPAPTVVGEGEAAEISRNGTKSHKRYTTCCRPSISAHDDQNTFMLFRLIRVKQKANWEEYEDQEGSDHEADGETVQGKENKQGKKGGGGGGKGGKNKDKSHSITEDTREE